jgi:hypothetical protein
MIKNVFEIVQREPYKKISKRITHIPIPSNFLSLKYVFYYLDKKLGYLKKKSLINAKFTLGCSPFIDTFFSNLGKKIKITSLFISFLYL